MTPASKNVDSEALIPRSLKLSDDNDENSDLLHVDESPVIDIVTFDGVKFFGEKPKSDETLIKIMEMLKIPHERGARILKEEIEFGKKALEKAKISHNFTDNVEHDQEQNGCSTILKPSIHVTDPDLSIE